MVAVTEQLDETGGGEWRGSQLARSRGLAGHSRTFSDRRAKDKTVMLLTEAFPIRVASDRAVEVLR